MVSQTPPWWLLILFLLAGITITAGVMVAMTWAFGGWGFLTFWVVALLIASCDQSHDEGYGQ